MRCQRALAAAASARPAHLDASLDPAVQAGRNDHAQAQRGARELALLLLLLSGELAAASALAHAPFVLLLLTILLLVALLHVCLEEMRPIGTHVGLRSSRRVVSDWLLQLEARTGDLVTGRTFMFVEHCDNSECLQPSKARQGAPAGETVSRAQ